MVIPGAIFFCKIPTLNRLFMQIISSLTSVSRFYTEQPVFVVQFAPPEVAMR